MISCAGVAQLFPVGHFGDDAGALVADGVGGAADVVADLRVRDKLFGGPEIRGGGGFADSNAHETSPASVDSEDFGDVKAADPGALPAEAAGDVHEAGVVGRGADFSARSENAADFVGEHGGGDFDVLDGECPAEAAALLGFW